MSEYTSFTPFSKSAQDAVNVQSCVQTVAFIPQSIPNNTCSGVLSEERDNSIKTRKFTILLKNFTLFCIDLPSRTIYGFQY